MLLAAEAHDVPDDEEVAGEIELLDEIELARDLPNVKFVGMLSYQELRRLYRHAVALIVPSLCYEVFGMVLIESFSVKTPVIVRDLGGLPEVVSDSNGGFVYRTDQDLVQAMERLQELSVKPEHVAAVVGRDEPAFVDPRADGGPVASDAGGPARSGTR